MKECVYWDGQTSEPKSVSLWVMDDVVHLEFLSEINPDRCQFHQFQVSERIADTPRFIRFSDGSQLEIEDNDWVDFTFGVKDTSHGLENKGQVAALSTVFVVLIAFLLYNTVLPGAVNLVAEKVPTAMLNSIAAPTVALLDERVFAPSGLDEELQTQITHDFHKLIQNDSVFTYQLLFRDGGEIGANAFALPNGTIIITDQLIDLAENHEEIYAVLAHEIGHVEGRHAVRMLLKQLGTVALFTGLLGDVSFISDTVIAAPLLLTQMAMSREFEDEADQYSHAVMLHYNVSPEHFANIIERLHESHDHGQSANTFFSSHPDPKDRAKKAREMAESFQGNE